MALTAMMLAPAAHAEWSISPTASIQVNHIDNYRVSEFNKESSTITEALIQARANNVGEAHEVRALIGAGLSKYSESETEDDTRENFFVELKGARKFERSRLNLTARVRREDLTRQLRIFQLDETDEIVDDTLDPAADTTTVDDDILTGGDPDRATEKHVVSRHRIDAAPRYSYRLSARASANLHYRFQRRTYHDHLPDGVESSLIDSTGHGGGLQLRYLVSPRNTAELSVNFRHFNPEGKPSADTWSARLGWSRRLTELTKMNLEAGVRRTKRFNDSRTGAVFKARLDRRGLSGQTFLVAERSILPNAYGDVVETDRLRVGWRKRLSERFGFSLAAAAHRTDYAKLAGAIDYSRKYIQLRPELLWQLVERVAVGFNYSYLWLDRASSAKSANSHAFGVTLYYAPRGIRL